MDSIKLATPEQVERIKDSSDLGPTSAVLAMGEDLAVVKQVTEVDPIYFAEGSAPSRRMMFMWFLQNYLKLTGQPALYFNTAESDTAWQDVLKKHFGAEQLSKEPELRFKVAL